MGEDIFACRLAIVDVTSSMSSYSDGMTRLVGLSIWTVSCMLILPLPPVGETVDIDLGLAHRAGVGIWMKTRKARKVFFRFPRYSRRIVDEGSSTYEVDA
jgi:hypothetical protein